jgi:hypothetical protein
MGRDGAHHAAGAGVRALATGGRVRSEVVSVSLTPGDWRFIVERLRRGGDVGEIVGYIDEAKWGRALAERVIERLEDGSV